MYSTLKKINQRIQISFHIDLFAKILCATLGFSVLLKIAEILFPFQAPGWEILLSGSFCIYLVFSIRRKLKSEWLDRAAGMADKLGGLRDEIKTAYWFMRHPKKSAWIDLQLKGAAKSLDSMKINELFPLSVSKWFWGVFVLIAVQVSLGVLPSQTPLFFSDAGSQAPFSDMEVQIAELETILGSEVGSVLEDADRESLEEVLEDLKADEFDSEEVLRQLQEAEDLFNEESFEMDALNQEMAQIAEEFSDTDDLSVFSNSLGSSEFGDAADQLRELSERLSDMTPTELNNLEEGLQPSQNAESLSIEELLSALNEAGTALSQDEMSMAEGALTEAAATLDAMAQDQNLEEALNEAATNMQAMSQQVTQNANSSSLDPEGEMTAGSSGTGSDEVTQSSGGESGEGSGPAGNSTGTPSENAELELGEATTLEVQLNLEVIEEGLIDELPDPENLFQGGSQRQQSELEFRDVNGLAGYSPASALDIEVVFWEYRDLVKDYFLGIRPLRENDNRNR